jgi:DNA/RNA-binding domain of Phe-tRNA-synthetase-like protein
MSEVIYRLEIDPSLDPSPVLPALIWAEGIAAPHPTEEAPAFLTEILTQAVVAGEEFVPAALRKRVRKMLRHGKYHASGRGKPASEFLLRAALAGSFPLVNGPVDVNNAISLASGLPGTIFDTDLSGTHLLLRRGRPEESYAFNRSGQTIDLQDLLLVCRRVGETWEPCGNPVKDAMSTKINPETKRVIAVLYAPMDEPISSLEGLAARYADLLKAHCEAEEVGFKVLTA